MRSIQQGFLLTRHSFDQGGHTRIILWVTTPAGPAKLVIDGERPLFFVAAEDEARVRGALDAQPIDYQLRLLKLKTFDQQPVAAVYLPTVDQHLRASRLLHAAGITLYESDFRLHDRYLMERFVYGGLQFVGDAIPGNGYTEYRHVRLKGCDFKPNLRVVSLDIECSGSGELFSIGLHGDGIFQVLMIGDPQPANTPIRWVSDEPALLQALEKTFATVEPDIIIGWSVVGFDFRLLIKRAEHHGIRLKLGRDRAEARWREGRDNRPGFLTLPGRVVIDGIDALKSATYNFPSFSLESVSQSLLGKGKKVDDVGDRLQEIVHNFSHDKPKLAAYNLEDCRLVAEIFDKTQLIDFLRLRSQLTGLELDRMGGSVAAFTHLYLPKLHRAGYVAPNLPESGGLASPGGYVMDSKPGLYRHVLVLDFKSLYPSIIRTFKIDPLGLIEGLRHPEQAIEGFQGARFSRDHHFLPRIITELWQQRDEAKRDKDAARSQAIKILMNSFYGVLGAGGCRFYDTRLASSITLRGHQLMQQTARWIEEQGYQVIYGDTDSTFVWLNGTFSDAEADGIGERLAAGINRYWQETIHREHRLESHLEMEYETHFRRFLMPTIRGSDAGSKKRYAGLTGSGQSEQLVFKGLETVRTDWTELARELQVALYRQVFHDEEPSRLIRDTVDATLAGNKDSQLVYRKRLRRPLAQYVKNVPPHVKAARLADEQNRRLGKPLKYQHKGTIRYLITVNGPEPLEYHTSPIDYQHYIDRQIKPVCEGILPFIGLNFEDVVNAQLGLF